MHTYKKSSSIVVYILIATSDPVTSECEISTQKDS